MSANLRSRWTSGSWRAVCRAARKLASLHAEQVHVWDVWFQANRAAVPEEGPLTWVLTLDGYRLAGGHLPAGSDARTGGTP